MAEVALSEVIILDGARDEVFIEEQNLVQLLMEVDTDESRGVVNTLLIRRGSSRANGLTIDYR
jgi:hypothetical protein